MLGMQFFNKGSVVLLNLAAQDMFKAYYHLEPSRVQILTAYIALPWSLKIVIGLISDSLPIFGSRRKAYLLIAGVA